MAAAKVVASASGYDRLHHATVMDLANSDPRAKLKKRLQKERNSLLQHALQVDFRFQ